MNVSITLWLSEEEGAALAAQARRYAQSNEDRVWAWVRPSLTEAVKEWQARQWERRRRTLAADHALAATVDAAAEAP